MVTAYGYAEIGGTNYVSYMNPWEPDCQKVASACSSKTGGEDTVSTYDAFVDDGVHNWGNSFYKFKYLVVHKAEVM